MCGQMKPEVHYGHDQGYKQSLTELEDNLGFGSLGRGSDKADRECNDNIWIGILS